MNVVDSSGWLEFFAGSERAAPFREPILNTERLVVPVVSIYEVFKVMSRQRADALQSVEAMHQGHVVNLTTELAIRAARLSLEHTLPMADAIILATAYAQQAELWTQDAHFKGLPSVRYFPRQHSAPPVADCSQIPRRSARSRLK